MDVTCNLGIGSISLESCMEYSSDETWSIHVQVVISGKFVHNFTTVKWVPFETERQTLGFSKRR